MKKIKNNITNTIIIEKSKFICSIFRVKNIDEVNNILKENNKKYYDATHNPYAYVLDNGNIQKCSDDGEPQKTSGYPMLEVLNKNELTDCLAIVTRYFGGIKLGAGGLLRAYSNSVSECLKQARYEEEKELLIYQVEISYPNYSKLESFLNEFNILEQSFSNSVVVRLGVLESLDNYFKEQLKNLTLGKVILTFIRKDKVNVEITN